MIQKYPYRPITQTVKTTIWGTPILHIVNTKRFWLLDISSFFIWQSLSLYIFKYLSVFWGICHHCFHVRCIQKHSEIINISTLQIYLIKNSMLEKPPAFFQKIKEGFLKEEKRLMRLKVKVKGNYWVKNGIKQSTQLINQLRHYREYK